MSSYKNKTPSETYNDILYIGESFKGIEDVSCPITDGAGIDSKILVSKKNIDIDFNGGKIGPSEIIGSPCKGYQIHRLAHSDSVDITVGNPGTNIIMAYFNPSPEEEDLVAAPPEVPGGFYSRIVVNLKLPSISADFGNILYSSYSDIYFYQDRNSDAPCQLWFDSGGYTIDGEDKYACLRMSEYDHLRVYLLGDIESGNFIFKIDTIGTNIFFRESE